VSTRVSPVERIRADIEDLFASDCDLGEVLEEVARLGVRLLMQTAIEAEVTEFLGRERYAHGERVRQGSRNGHCPTTIKTTTGPVTIERPKLRGTDEAFASRLLGVGVCRTNALECLVIAGFVRGLSVRDVEATLVEALGAEAALSKSTVSRVCEAIKDEFDTWKKRDLADVHLEYLFLDGSHFRMHDGARAEPVLAAWGMTTGAVPCSWAWSRAPRSPPMPGPASWRAWSVAACERRCWWCLMAPPACSPQSSSSSRTACTSVV
jgi:transposase-like protein